ncbi:MAG: glycosyltransferase family 2 protein [Anaerostipes sp.]|nr:glycosyltransferase family 2 protein [Anaerostipes sp.]
MKLLSFAVPCYNSQEYMRHCIDTLLTGGEQVEILIINDGSSDNTADIANEYAKKYPTICKAIHQENKGHGGAVNTGLANATGIYFKVVDSDDWVSEFAYEEILDKLNQFYHQGTILDMILSNYVYEKQGAKRKTAIHYRHAIPKEKIFTWDDVKRFPLSQYILMHSVIYRTSLLHECMLELPEHTFYVDNIYVYKPLPFVKSMYYIDVNFYRYFIGRDDQSVNENNMIKRLDQQLFVTRWMIDYMTSFEIVNKPLYCYMKHYLSIIMTVTSVIAIKSGTKENLQLKKDLWIYLKTKDSRLYRSIRRTLVGNAVNIPGKGGRKTTMALYKAARKFVGFN